MEPPQTFRRGVGWAAALPDTAQFHDVRISVTPGTLPHPVGFAYTGEQLNDIWRLAQTSRCAVLMPNLARFLRRAPTGPSVSRQ